jgi:threonine synthase
VSLGEGGTPLVPFDGLWLKLESANPTGSFKDRGAAMLADAALRAGAHHAVCDSSGNAGIAAATYFSRAGIPIEVFVPAGASPAKLAAIEHASGHVVRVEGPRENAASAAADRVADTGAFYASHVHHPAFLVGTAAIAGELVEQLGGAPRTIVMPVGNGSLLLGIAQGFTALGGDEPALVGVQSTHCMPLAAAFAAELDAPIAVDAAPTVADGIAIAAPPRGREILAAVRATSGQVVAVAVDEASILAAQDRLATAGHAAEPTGAVALAGVLADLEAPVVVLVTGSAK